MPKADAGCGSERLVKVWFQLSPAVQNAITVQNGLRLVKVWFQLSPAVQNAITVQNAHHCRAVFSNDPSSANPFSRALSLSLSLPLLSRCLPLSPPPSISLALFLPPRPLSSALSRFLAFFSLALSLARSISRSLYLSLSYRGRLFVSR